MNLPVDFTAEAIQDLSAIAYYANDTWGREQAFRYAELLNKCFMDIAEGRLFSKVLFPQVSQGSGLSLRTSLYFLHVPTRKPEVCHLGRAA